MKNKFVLTLISGAIISAGSALAGEQPTITINFVDPKGLCQTKGKTQFAFNYKYLADNNIEYYSGPINVENSPQKIQVPPLPKDGVSHYYTDFEITDQGDCGNFDLDYYHPGNCYLTNLIPTEDQQSPYSYKIIITPQATGNDTFGTPMYNLTCSLQAYLDK